ncbi:MAG: hypothetical protein HOY71_22570 [Nonomuraea sp.]|nr:hypothetical protein [Nonomuraea sp.]
MLRLGRWTNSWHAIISGTLSLVLGALLLVTAADPEATGLLPIAAQYALETGIVRLGSGISNAAVITAAVVLITSAAAIRLVRRRPRTHTPASSAPPSSRKP